MDFIDYLHYLAFINAIDRMASKFCLSNYMFENDINIRRIRRSRNLRLIQSSNHSSNYLLKENRRERKLKNLVKINRKEENSKQKQIRKYIIDMINDEKIIEEIENNLPKYEEMYRDECDADLHDDILLIKDLILNNLPIEVIKIFINSFNNEDDKIKSFLNDASKNTSFNLEFYNDLLIGKKYDIVKLLIEYGLDINGLLRSNEDSVGLKTILIYLIEKEFDNEDISEAINFLLDNEADLDKPDDNGSTVIHKACFHNMTNLFSDLVTETNVDSVDNNGDTPLMIGIKENHHEFVDKILSYPYTDINRVNKDNKTAMDVAIDNSINDKELFDKLFKKGAFINYKYIVNPPLSELIEKNNELIQYIAKNGIYIGGDKYNNIKNYSNPVIYFTKFN